MVLSGLMDMNLKNSHFEERKRAIDNRVLKKPGKGQTIMVMTKTRLITFLFSNKKVNGFISIKQ